MDMAYINPCLKMCIYSLQIWVNAHHDYHSLLFASLNCVDVREREDDIILKSKRGGRGSFVAHGCMMYP